MSTPIWPQIIYPIGDLPDGKYYVVIAETGFSYCKDLPDFDLPSICESDWEDTDVDTEPYIHVEWDEDSYTRLTDALEKAS